MLFSGASTQSASFNFQNSPVGHSCDPLSSEEVGVQGGGSGLLSSRWTSWGMCQDVTEGQQGHPRGPGRLYSLICYLFTICHLCMSAFIYLGIYVAIHPSIHPFTHLSHCSTPCVTLYNTHLQDFYLGIHIHFILFLSCCPRCSNSFLIRTVSLSASLSDVSTLPRVDGGDTWAPCGAALAQLPRQEVETEVWTRAQPPAHPLQ